LSHSDSPNSHTSLLLNVCAAEFNYGMSSFLS
jgi:hypothetical protein